jgi:uncharacterized lipoprotein NlpE involved in copper resistance
MGNKMSWCTSVDKKVKINSHEHEVYIKISKETLKMSEKKSDDMFDKPNGDLKVCAIENDKSQV